MPHIFHPSILRAYDIRGIHGQTLFDQDAFFIGKSFASFLQKKQKQKIAVACDGRLSSPVLKTQLIKGLSESGLHVIDVGLGPTPMLYFATHHLACDAGIMVTGSHNPGSHNGFKMMLRERPFFGEDILGLAKLAADGAFVDEAGKVEQQDISQDYINRILADCPLAKSESRLLDEIDQFTPRKKLRIAWDAGNGAAGEIMQRLSKRILADHVLLFAEIDGSFPNHHPDPTVASNLQDLIKTVLTENCDFGIAFDGDGDRIGVVDDEGEIIWGDQLMIFFAREILAEKPGATIIADVKASNVLFDEIRKAGGNALMWKTGHSFIKAKMKESKAALAGEMSGHIFFADKYFGFDDALYAAIRLINIIEQSRVSLSVLRKALPKTFSTPEIRIECSEEWKFKIIDELKKSVNNFNDIDGIRVDEKDGWWLIRASNTQPVLVARAEASSEEKLEALKNNLKKLLESCQVVVPQELQ
ncbi:MAG: phosphomannomutase/phosphoglucomutase [Alphaproteobacteria bacterium]|nr:phosphomannomutase/phosphoglucomutase [Alphaproteobacteria bacterium]